MAEYELDHPERPDGVPAPASAPAAPERDRPAWPLWTAFAALVCGWLGGSVLGAIVYGIASASGHKGGNSPIGYDLAANLLFDACLVGAAVLFARLAGPVSPRSFGLRTTKLWPAVGWGFAAYAVYIVGSLIWLNALGIQDQQDNITTQLIEDPTPVTVAGLAIFAVVIAPIVEELFFRGFVFNAMRSKLPVGWAGGRHGRDVRRRPRVRLADRLPGAAGAARHRSCVSSTGRPARCCPASRCTR